MIPQSQLTGLSTGHLQQLQDGFLIHKDMVTAWQALCQAAAAAGITLKIVSAFRSFERQAAIWQAKYQGKRPVYNLQQQPYDINNLHGYQKLEAILLYSALPGASRHHWGTELDLYDVAAVDKNYQPQLQPGEYSESGVFYFMSQWLQSHAADFGFYLPYQRYQGGVAAEPWHLSFRPLSQQFATELTLPALQQCLEQHPVAGQQEVLQYLPEIYRRFITNTCEDKI